MTAIATVRFEIVDVTEDADLRRQLADALAAVEEWRALAKRHETQTSAWFSEAQAEKHTRETLANDLAKCGEELTTARAENERLRGELANRVRIHVDEVSAERDRLRAAVEQLSRTPDALREELGIARESLRLCRRELSEVDRKLRDANADRDRAIAERDAARTERRACEAECELLRKENCGLRDDVEGAIAERDEARKALADRGGVTLGIYANACRTRDEASAELAALRARVAELEGEEERRRRVAFIAAGGKRFTIFEYAEFAQGRIRELEAKIEARDNRARVLRERLDAIAGISTRD